ncbi:hypothetical protein B5S32_g27 [[Candida] boidinii]|nr:hypothetical protein B5S32_g27 [[Candida] boidinii]
MANVALSSHFRDFFVCSDFTECLETTLIPIVMKQLGTNKLSYLLNSVENYNSCSNSYNEKLFGVNESIEDKYLNIVSKANKFASNLINDTLTNVSLNNLVNKESVIQGKNGLATVNTSNANKPPQYLNSLDSLSITNALNNLYNSSKEISKHGIDISNEVSNDITIKYRKYVHDLISAIEKSEESFKELNKDLITTRLNLIKDQNTYINNSEKLIQFKRDNYLNKEIFSNFEMNLNFKKLNNRIKLIDSKTDSTDINIKFKELKTKPINKLKFFNIINKMIISIKTEKLKQTSSLPFNFNSKLIFQFKGCDFYDYCKKNLICDFDIEKKEEGEEGEELDEENIKSFGNQLISLKLVKPPNSIDGILNSSAILYQWTDLAYYLSGNIIQSRVDSIYEDENMYEVNDTSNNNINSEETSNEGNELTKIFKKLNVSSGDLINQTIGLTNPNLNKSTLSLISNTNSIDSISNSNINSIDYEFKQLYLIMKKSNDKYIESLLKYDEELCKFEESMFEICNFLEFKYFEIKKQVKIIINEFLINYGHNDSIIKLNNEINIENNEELFEFFKYENDLRQRKYLPTIHVYEAYPSNFKSIKQIFGIDLPKLCLLHNTKIPIIIVEIIKRINKNFNIHQKFEIWNNKLSKKNDLTDILEIRNRINNIFLNNTNNSNISDKESEVNKKLENEKEIEIESKIEGESDEQYEGYKQEQELGEYYYNDYQNFERQINIILDSLKPNLLGLLIKRYLLELPESLIKRSAIIAFNELFDENDEESKESLNFDKAFKNFYNEFNEKELKIIEKGNEKNINEINILNDFEFFNKNLLGCLLHHWNEIINEIEQELNSNDNDNNDKFFNSESKDEFIKSLACNYVSVILKPNNDEDEFLRDEYCFTFFKKLIECYKK